MVSVILAHILEILLGAGVLIAGVYGAIQKRRADHEKQRADQAEGYRDTRKRMDEAAGDLPNVPHDAREWLQQRGDQ